MYSVFVHCCFVSRLSYGTQTIEMLKFEVKNGFLTNSNQFTNRDMNRLQKNWKDFCRFCL